MFLSLEERFNLQAVAHPCIKIQAYIKNITGSESSIKTVIYRYFFYISSMK